MSDQISTIETKRILTNPNNPRSRIEDVSDLVASIKKNGLLQPITVRWTKKKDKEGIPTGYEVIAGSRRLAACHELGLEKVNCIVKVCNDEEAFEIATTENLVRENMTAADEARAVKKLFDQGKSRLEVAGIFGKSVAWAEGRRRIANLGEKALTMLDKGQINLGHAEALCLCDEDRVESWLDTAKWRKPEELRREILVKDRRLLQKAPFNYKKICEKCPNRSDCQRDLFGCVTDVYCLDSECYQKQIEKECARIEKEFKKAGYTPVPEARIWSAQNGYGGFINASTKDERKIEEIKKIKENGGKAMYWIDEKTAQSGLVFERLVEVESDSDDDNDETLFEELKDIEDYEDRDEIIGEANPLEIEDVEKSLSEFLEKNVTNEKLLVVLFNSITDIYYYDEEKSEQRKTFIKSAKDKITEENCNEEKLVGKSIVEIIAKYIAKKIDNNANYYNGIHDFWRETFNLKSRGAYLLKAKENFLNKAENANDESEEEESEE